MAPLDRTAQANPTPALSAVAFDRLDTVTGESAQVLNILHVAGPPEPFPKFAPPNPQHSTAPPATIAHAKSVPVAIVVAEIVEATGDNAHVVAWPVQADPDEVPVPSSPYVFSPQHWIVPLESRTQAYRSPAVKAVAPDRLETDTGIAYNVLSEPLPSSPNESFPQHETPPPETMAQAKPRPVAMAVAAGSPVIWWGG
jgi:hypothetical protein